ncbi:Ig-like domain-containing protein [Moritella viscosa]
MQAWLHQIQRVIPVVSNAAEHAVTFDGAADAGTVTIGTVASDDVINAVEAGAATIAVSGTATGGDISTGDTVTVTVNGQDYTTTVDGSGNYTVDVNTTDLQADNTIDASVASSDTAGNTVVSNAAEHAATFDVNTTDLQADNTIDASVASSEYSY